MRAVDTNVLLRLLLGDHPRQCAAAKAFVAPGAWVHLVTLAETVWVLESNYGLARDQLVTAVELLLDQQSLSVQEPEVVKAALTRFGNRAGVSFSDCLILEGARKAGHLPVGTFDRDLAKVEGAELLRPG